MRESPQALDAKTRYVNMGPERSIAAVAQQCRKSVSLLNRWSQRHGWVEAARQHDEAIAAKATKRDAEERAKRISQMREARLGISVEMLKMGREALIERARDGKIGAYAAVQMIQLANETQRKDMDEPDARVDVAGGLTIRVVYDDAPASSIAPD